jgi:predicted kinase
LELSALLDRSDVTEAEITEFAYDLGRFHLSAAPAPTSVTFQHTQQLRSAVLGNLTTLLSHLRTTKGLPAIGSLVDWTHDYLKSSFSLLQMREQSGFIRECHGDLHSRNIVRWKGRLTPFDCLEFDPNLRWIDVMNDVAFLVMDLASHGRKDLAFCFLNAYLETTGDYEGVPMVPFYAIYRALIRAMVDSLAAERDAEHHDFLKRLEMRVATAAEFMTRPSPTLFIMRGPSGSGKSWLSKQLVGKLEAVRIRSDSERKRLVGADAPLSQNTDFARGLYAPQITHRTYGRLIECAQHCLNAGFSAIVDATFLKIVDRRMFHDLAMRSRVRYIIVSCTADLATLIRRVEVRQRAHTDVSDAGSDILDRQLQSMEPLESDEQSHCITVDTSRQDACSQALEMIRRRIEDSWR